MSNMSKMSNKKYIVGILAVLLLVAILSFLQLRFPLSLSSYYADKVVVDSDHISMQIVIVASAPSYAGYSAEYHDGALYLTIKGTMIRMLSEPPDITIPNTYGTINAIYLKGQGTEGDKEVWQATQ